MKGSSTLEMFAWDKFREEDDDDLNLTIMDPKRKSHRDMAEEILKDYVPVKIDEKGNKHYSISVLEEAWKKAKYVC